MLLRPNLLRLFRHLEWAFFADRHKHCVVREIQNRGSERRFGVTDSLSLYLFWAFSNCTITPTTTSPLPPVPLTGTTATTTTTTNTTTRQISANESDMTRV
eukprot:737953-Amphidinium_carterae.1